MMICARCGRRTQNDYARECQAYDPDDRQPCRGLYLERGVSKIIADLESEVEDLRKKVKALHTSVGHEAVGRAVERLGAAADDG